MNKVNYNKLLAKAYCIIGKAYENVYDKGGNPYIEHCLRVAHNFFESRKRIKALLHDLVEDNYSTWAKLRKQGFSEDILDSLKLLTHNKEKDTYEEYIEKIASSKDQDAIDVKKADLMDNSNLARIKGLTQKDFVRAQKYQIAYIKLSKTE